MFVVSTPTRNVLSKQQEIVKTNKTIFFPRNQRNPRIGNVKFILPN